MSRFRVSSAASRHLGVQHEFVGIQFEPVKQAVDVVLQVVGLAAGGLGIFLLFPACDNAFVHRVQIADQGGQRRAHVVGKAGHELSVGLLRFAQGGQFFLVGGDNVVDLIHQGGRQFAGRRREDAPVAVSPA